MTTYYQGSRGPVEIASMPYPHAIAAKAKLIRDGYEKDRAAEIEALSEHIANIEATFEENREGQL